tara:strand:- start:6420 stop:6878 length:459 start_codon:yes stop_codon:yes gene_type:complete
LKIFNKLNYIIFTLFYVGKLPASGTFASAITVFLYYIIVSNFSDSIFFIIFLITTIYSFLFLKYVLKKFYDKDPKEIVVDEVIGQSVPLLICNKDIILVLISFILFRTFDILKIYPANIFDKKIEGTIGIIGDDLIAGLYTLILIYLIKIYI